MSGVDVAVAPLARAAQLLAAAIRALWLVVIPGLLACLTYRYGVPAPKGGVSGTMLRLAEQLSRHPTLTLLALFLAYVAMARYWAPRLPGASLWFEPEPEKARAFSGKQVAAWLAALALAVVVAVTLRQSVVQPYRVLSASMLPTLEPGAELLANRYAYGFHLPGMQPSAAAMPRRGDVVVFHKQLGPNLPNELVKRVVGLPGDTIVVRAGQLWINGWPAPSCDAGRYAYLNGDGLLDARLVVEFLEERAYLTAFFAAPDYGQHPYEVKPGEVFVLGDNRSNSSDSRFWNEGRGGGLALTDIEGRFDRRLFGVTRSGEADFSQFFKPLDLTAVHLEGLDTSDLQQGIERCLQNKPKLTRPPPPFSQQQPKK